MRARDWYDGLSIICITLTVMISLMALGIRMSFVSGHSMDRALHDRESVLVLSLFYTYTPQAGDIVVCQSENYGMDTPLVKRVIATEGQTVTMDEDLWAVYVDGIRLTEAYITPEDEAMSGWEWGESYTVPEGCVFVMGDNRNHSLDSRYAAVGAIDVRLITGKVVCGFFPFQIYENPFSS